MSNDTNVMDQLARLSPDTDALERRWPENDRAELAARILGGDLGGDSRLRHRPVRRRSGSRRRRLVIGSSLVAAALVAAIVAPALLPQGSPGGASPAAAAALEILAVVAADTPADAAGPTDFIHTVVRTHQVGVFVDSDPGDRTRDLDSRTESWTGSGGDEWQVSSTVAKDEDGVVLRDAGSTLRLPGDSGQANGFGDAWSAYGSPLPVDPDELQRFLGDHVSGSNSTDEAVFLALGDVLRSTTSPAALRSTALTVLARTRHVSLGDTTTDSLGRPVQEFTFSDDTVRRGVVQTYLIDPRTAQLIEERTTQPQMVVTRTVLSSEVVPSVPAEVRSAAVSQD